MKKELSPQKKKFTERLLQKMLGFMAHTIIRRHKPFIIGVTGSIGKTSTKDTIVHVLSPHMRVRGTKKNYNNEIGLPLTIIGMPSPGSSLVGWVRVGIGWIKTLTSQDYPEVLVLEYGIDHPGDMDVLSAIAPPQISVVTRISDAHREFFESIKSIAQEKGGLVAALENHENSEYPCAAVLNADDARVLGMQSRTSKSVYTYGTSTSADIHAMHITHSEEEGLSFKCGYKERSLPIRLPHVIAKHQISSVLAALSVAQILRLNLLEIVESLTTYTMPPSRMHLLPGAGTWQVIDDTYNSSPDALAAALETLGTYEDRRRVAILGDMLELGDAEEGAHKNLAKKIIQNNIGFVICVGVRMKILFDVLHREECGYKGEVVHVLTPDEAVEMMGRKVQDGDIILIKGSQGMRMEKIVIALTPHEVHSHVCRQDSHWKKRVFIQP